MRRRIIRGNVVRRIGNRWRTGGSTGTSDHRRTGRQSAGSGILRSLPSGNHVVEPIRAAGLSRKNCPSKRCTLHTVVYPVLLQRCYRMNDRTLLRCVHCIRYRCNVVYGHIGTPRRTHRYTVGRSAPLFRKVPVVTFLRFGWSCRLCEILLIGDSAVTVSAVRYKIGQTLPEPSPLVQD